MIIYTHNISIFKHDWNDDPQQQTYPAGWVETSTDTKSISRLQDGPGRSTWTLLQRQVAWYLWLAGWCGVDHLLYSSIQLGRTNLHTCSEGLKPGLALSKTNIAIEHGP